MWKAFEILVENRITAAIADGAFENLPGRGSPLRLLDDSLVPAEWRLGFHLLRNAGLAPAWIELRAETLREIDRARSSLAAFEADDPERGPAEVRYARRANLLNQQITHYNLIAPGPRWHIPVLDVADDLRRLVPAGLEDRPDGAVKHFAATDRDSRRS